MKITKGALYLLLIVLLGLALRTISAHYVDIGSDEIIYSLIPYNIISAGRLSTVEQAPLYFYLVDMGYKLSEGITLISTRWPSIVFGAFGSLIIFLISMELFKHKKAAYVSAFLFAMSGFSIRWNQEMDMTAYFFALLSLYFFIRTIKGEQKQLYLTALFLALGVMAKPIVLLFVPAYLIILIWQGWNTKSGLLHRHERKIVYNKKTGKVLLIACIIMILVVMPVLVYNYLLYQEKGITDYYFTVLAGVGNNKIYAVQEAELWTFTRFIGVSKQILFSWMWKYNAVILIFGFFGIGFAWKKDKYGTALLVLTIAFLLLYLAGKMGSPTHYVWIPIVLSISAGYGLVRIHEQTIPRINFKYVMALLIILISINTLFVLKEIIPLRKNSIQNVLHDYATENIPADAIVVLDPRIYRGIYAWAFYNRHYLEGTYFPELAKKLDNFPGEKQNLPLYYIECGPGKNCGWKPEDFQRIYDYGKQLSATITPQMKKIQELRTVDTFIIYQRMINAPTSIYEPIDRTHTHWYTPVGWKYPENAVDTYTPRTILDKLLNSFGFFILYLVVLVALLSPALVVYLLWKRSD